MQNIVLFYFSMSNMWGPDLYFAKMHPIGETRKFPLYVIKVMAKNHNQTLFTTSLEERRQLIKAKRSCTIKWKTSKEIV